MSVVWLSAVSRPEGPFWVVLGTRPEPPQQSMELGEGVQVGLVDRVGAGLAMNEKTAGITFPDSSGRLDFNSGFASDNPRFHKWCADLFVFHWNKAKVMQRASKT